MDILCRSVYNEFVINWFIPRIYLAQTLERVLKYYYTIIRGRDFMIQFKPYEYQIPCIPKEERSKILPPHSICSIAPSSVDRAPGLTGTGWAHVDPTRPDHFITGNGSHWIQVAGQPYNDECIFTQELLYRPLWKKTPMPPDYRPVLPQMRKLMLEGKHDEVNKLVDDTIRKSEVGKYAGAQNKDLGTSPMPTRHTAFRLTYHQPEAEKTWDYLRWLDTQTGLISAVWTNERGTYRSETFAACDGDFTVTRLSAPAGKLDVSVIFHAQHEDHPKEYIQCTTRCTLTSSLFSYAMAYEADRGEKGYVSVVRLIPEGGASECIENGVRVTGADSLLVLTRTIPYSSGFSFDRIAGAEQAMLAVQPDFCKLLAANEAHIGAKMDRSRLHLGKPEDYVLSGEELLRRTHSENSLDPTMLEKLYDMSRFYTIYDTGKTVPPAWGQHNINTNVQVCAGNNTGLWDEMNVYFKYYEDRFDDFRINAQRFFNARGLLASVHCDPDSGLMYSFNHIYPHFCWTGCLGWIFNELWGYYLVTGDKEFLRNRVIPGLKEIALFFEDYACDKDENGKGIFYPSFSPEDATMPVPGVLTISFNSVMDIGVCREVLTNLIDGCRTLGIEEENIPHWEAQLESLPIYLLDEEGGLKEWAWPGLAENYDHRHVSHHYEVWPGRLITPEETPELAEAVRISNRKRAQQNDSAHGIIHRAFTAMRLKDVEETTANMAQLMTHGFVRRTLQTNHYPYKMFFPDLLGAMAALLLEMAVFSKPGTVEFLPAMPETLSEGRLDGIWLYTFAKLESMTWSREGVHAVLTSNEDQTLAIRCRGMKSLFVNGQPQPLTGDHVVYTFRKGETIEIDVAL